MRSGVFVEAAEAFAPLMVRDLVKLQALARRADDAMRDLPWTRPKITWHHIGVHVGVMRKRRSPTTFSPLLDRITDPARRRDVYRLHRELPAWAERWFLVKEEGRFIGHWVLATALASLTSRDEPVALRQPEHSLSGPIHIVVPPFQVQPWTGDESPAAWRGR